jgi:hypothetical protein
METFSRRRNFGSPLTISKIHLSGLEGRLLFFLYAPMAMDHAPAPQLRRMFDLLR